MTMTYDDTNYMLILSLVQEYGIGKTLDQSRRLYTMSSKRKDKI